MVKKTIILSFLFCLFFACEKSNSSDSKKPEIIQLSFQVGDDTYAVASVSDSMEIVLDAKHDLIGIIPIISMDESLRSIPANRKPANFSSGKYNSIEVTGGSETKIYYVKFSFKSSSKTQVNDVAMYYKSQTIPNQGVVSINTKDNVTTIDLPYTNRLDANGYVITYKLSTGAVSDKRSGNQFVFDIEKKLDSMNIVAENGTKRKHYFKLNIAPSTQNYLTRFYIPGQLGFEIKENQINVRIVADADLSTPLATQLQVSPDAISSPANGDKVLYTVGANKDVIVTSKSGSQNTYKLNISRAKPAVVKKLQQVNTYKRLSTDLVEKLYSKQFLKYNAEGMLIVDSVVYLDKPQNSFVDQYLYTTISKRIYEKRRKTTLVTEGKEKFNQVYTTRYTYNEQGLLIKSILSRSQSGFVAWETIDYEYLGARLTKTSTKVFGAPGITTYKYDAQGNLITIDYPTNSNQTSKQHATYDNWINPYFNIVPKAFATSQVTPFIYSPHNPITYTGEKNIATLKGTTYHQMFYNYSDNLVPNSLEYYTENASKQKTAYRKEYLYN